MFELIPGKIEFNFLSKSKIAFLFSALVLAASVYIWVDVGQNRYGIDYLGGLELIVKIEGEVDSGSLRQTLEAGGLKGASVQSFEADSGEFSIRSSGGEEDSNAVVGSIKSILQSAYSGRFEVLATNFIGPTIGRELRRQALVAIVIGLFVMLGYITYRFELAFALGAVVALFHDVVVCLGVYLLVGHQLNMASLAAIMTIVGYSVNDTIVVFDRVREEMFKRREFDLVQLMNFCIGATLSRTIITSLLTLFAAVSLLIFGGGAIRDLSLLLVVGVISGTYSTIFIAAPVALAWENFRHPAGSVQD